MVATATTPKKRPIVNAFLDDDGAKIVLRERGEDGRTYERRVPAEYVSFHRAEDIGREKMRQLKSLEIVRGIRTEGSYVRISWNGENGRRNGRFGMKDNDVDTFEGDVNPVLLWSVESKIEIAKPRRCYLDLEGDSRVPLSQKENMRITSWSVVDHDTGTEFSGVLDEDTDEDEARLLEELVEVLEGYDQIAVWEGDWKGGEFDTVVLPARAQRCGIDFDVRRWLWLNQLAVWKRMNMHSAESGAEKESFKLEDIAYAQIGEGKEEVPDFVIERFGKDKCSRGLGAMTWELWAEGGRYRELLVRYNIRDSVILRKLELKKGYITLFQALCEVCGIVPVTRSLNPTAQMDGFMLRLGRERDHRFPTKSYSEDEDEDEDQFKGAFVIHPKSVASNQTDEEARRWRKENGLTNGILRDVHVCDFASLYPSVMRTWNLSADAVIGWGKDIDSARASYGNDVCYSPGTDLVTRTDIIGFLPLALAELIRLRKQWADLAASLPPGSPEWQDAMAKSTAYKVAANSFYGAGGSKYSRFNHRDVSEACTQNAVHLLKITATEAEKRKMVVAYGDTDSVFTFGPTETGYRKFVDWLNAFRFPAEVKKHGCKENHIKLTFEKTFQRLVFISAKAYCGRYSQYKGTPADRECHGMIRQFKKGVGLVWKDEKTEAERAKGELCPECGTIGKISGEPEIKGLAWKRGDKGRLARELQGRIIDCLVGGVKLREKGVKVHINHDLGVETPTEDIEVYRGIVAKMRDHILGDALPLEEVRLSRALNKSLREYDKSATEAHVRVARQLKERGQLVAKGARIEFVVVDGSKTPQEVIPAEDYAGECDRYYLWERVFSPTQSLLQAAFPDEDWEKWGKVRPAKAKKSKVPDEQLGLAILRVEPNRFGSNDELAVPAYRAAPLIVRIPERAGKEAVERVNKVFAKHPGARSVEVVIQLVSGAEAVLRTTARVSPSPKFREAIEEAIAGNVEAAS